jgi:hypothetical protein
MTLVRKFCGGSRIVTTAEETKSCPKCNSAMTDVVVKENAFRLLRKCEKCDRYRYVNVKTDYGDFYISPPFKLVHILERFLEGI